MWRITLPIFSLLAALPFYIPQLWFLTFIAFLPLFVRRDFKIHYWFGFLFSIFNYAFLLKAIYLTTHNLLLTAAIFIIFSIFFTLFQFGLPWIMSRLGVFYPIAFTFVEVLRLNFPFDGFPYGYLGKILVNIPFISLSLHYITVFGGTLFVLTVNWFIYKLIENWESSKRYYMAFLGISFLFVTSLAFIYKIRLKIPHYGLTIAIVQPFIKQKDKMGNISFREFYISYLLNYLEHYLHMSSKRLDLVLLPETIIPPGKIIPFIRAFKDFNIIFGAENIFFDFKTLNLRAENLAIFSEKGKIKGIYAKEILVPFGEYTPKGFKWLENYIPYLANIEYKSGRSFVTFNYKNLKIFPLLCNEVFYFIGPIKNVDIVTILANDGWFGLNFPIRHLSEVKLRAIETGKIFIFVNNNGYSGIVYPDGSYIGFPNTKIQILSL